MGQFSKVKMFKMRDEQFRFLDQPLMGFRSKYLDQLEVFVPRLLPHYDELVLRGFSEERHEQLKTHLVYLGVISNPILQQGEEDRPVYEALFSILERLRGESREAFLYGLRGALLIIQKHVSAAEDRMRGTSEAVDGLLEQGSLPEALRGGDSALEEALDWGMNVAQDRLQRLRAISSAYRDVYRVMADELRKAVPESAPVGSPA